MHGPGGKPPASVMARMGRLDRSCPLGRPRGIRGELLAESLSGRPERFAGLREVWSVRRRPYRRRRPFGWLRRSGSTRAGWSLSFRDRFDFRCRGGARARKCVFRHRAACRLRPRRVLPWPTWSAARWWNERPARSLGRVVGVAGVWRAAAVGGRRAREGELLVPFAGSICVEIEHGRQPDRGGSAGRAGGSEPGDDVSRADDLPGVLPGAVRARSGGARPRRRGRLEIRIHDLRDWTYDRHKTVDDRPFGGGEGMVLKPEPLFRGGGVDLARAGSGRRKVVLMSAQGRLFDQETARRLAGLEEVAADLRAVRRRGRASRASTWPTRRFRSATTC